ncbi:MAG: hypothetical protein JSS86_15850 [Cyanobacteria bacterium SZAS LIN-2]|nr:hypothetical protein [Cyanobacteria bacterium SZAS LIN-2]MBS2010431.1 hypothetical protein [Cyanobacteria bacterium SZAS TMP-1]
MQKSFVRLAVVVLTLGAGILAYGVSMFYEQKVQGNVIDLAGLYLYRGREGGLYPNFIQMTDGTVLFFVPVVQTELDALARGQKSSYTGLFQVFSPDRKTSKLTVLTVKKNGSTLQFGAMLAKDSEMERLMLTPGWYEARLFSVSYPECVGGSSIIRLHHGLFLITGGTAQDNSGIGAAFPQTATVFDSVSRRAVKTFKLQHRWHCHLSLLLPDGKVLLVGGHPKYLNMESNTAVEIVDAEHSFSRTLNCKAIAYSANPTACLDDRGNVILLGGSGSEHFSDYPVVELIDVRLGECRKVATLKVPRHFCEPGHSGPGPLNSISLPSRKFLISGGRAYRSDLFHLYGLDNLTSAEIVTLAQ